MSQHTFTVTELLSLLLRFQLLTFVKAVCTLFKDVLVSAARRYLRQPDVVFLMLVALFLFARNLALRSQVTELMEGGAGSSGASSPQGCRCDCAEGGGAMSVSPIRRTMGFSLSSEGGVDNDDLDL